MGHAASTAPSAWLRLLSSSKPTTLPSTPRSSSYENGTRPVTLQRCAGDRPVYLGGVKGGAKGNRMSGTLPVFTSEQGKAEVLDAYDAVLRKWPVPCAELDVPTTFGDTHVILSGPAGAPAVVMLHAFFATATSWYATAAALSERHRVFAVDIMGEANKSRPTRVISSADDYLQWFSQLADGLGLDRMSLVGNSMGGFGAAYCAMHMPGRVRRLALISPAATFHSILPFYTHIFLPKAAYLFFPWLPGIEWTMRRSVDWAFAGLPSNGPWEELFYRAMLYGTTQTRVMPRVFTGEELARIEAPTLLLVGEQERIYRPEKAASAARRLMPSVQVGLIPHAHHVAAIANPDAVNAWLTAFLGDQPDAAGSGPGC